METPNESKEAKKVVRLDFHSDRLVPLKTYTTAEEVLLKYDDGHSPFAALVIPPNTPFKFTGLPIGEVSFQFENGLNVCFTIDNLNMKEIPVFED